MYPYKLQLKKTTVQDCTKVLDHYNKNVVNGNWGNFENIKIKVGDISNFYPSSDMTIARNFLEKLVVKFKTNGFEFIAMAKPTYKNEIIENFHKHRDRILHRFGTNSKQINNKMVASTKLIRTGTTRLPFKKFYVLKLDFILQIVEHSIKYSMVHGLGIEWCQTDGAPIGNPLGYGLANLCAVAIETDRGLNYTHVITNCWYNNLI